MIDSIDAQPAVTVDRPYAQSSRATFALLLPFGASAVHRTWGG